MTSCVHWVGGISLKKIVPSSEEISVLTKPFKTLMKEFNLVRRSACNFTKNKLLHRYEAKTSEAYKICRVLSIYLISVDS